MLLTKHWMETRWRFLLGSAIFAVIYIMTSTQFFGRPTSTAPVAVRFGGMLSFFSLMMIMQATTLAGSGIRTQAPFRRSKGLHGSTHFTLSLPVTRLRLLSTRMVVGLLELLCIVAAASAAIWLAMGTQFQELNFSAADLTRYSVTMCVLAATVYAQSTLLSTFLDDVWQVWGNLILLFGIRALLSAVPIPDSLNPFTVIGSAAPFVTHSLPLSLIALALGVAVALTMTTARIIETRDY